MKFSTGLGSWLFQFQPELSLNLDRNTSAGFESATKLTFGVWLGCTNPLLGLMEAVHRSDC